MTTAAVAAEGAAPLGGAARRRLATHKKGMTGVSGESGATGGGGGGGGGAPDAPAVAAAAADVAHKGRGDGDGCDDGGGGDIPLVDKTAAAAPVAALAAADWAAVGGEGGVLREPAGADGDGGGSAVEGADRIPSRPYTNGMSHAVGGGDPKEEWGAALAAAAAVNASSAGVPSPNGVSSVLQADGLGDAGVVGATADTAVGMANGLLAPVVLFPVRSDPVSVAPPGAQDAPRVYEGATPAAPASDAVAETLAVRADGDAAFAMPSPDRPRRASEAEVDLPAAAPTGVGGEDDIAPLPMGLVVDSIPPPTPPRTARATAEAAAGAAARRTTHHVQLRRAATAAAAADGGAGLPPRRRPPAAQPPNGVAAAAVRVAVADEETARASAADVASGAAGAAVTQPVAATAAAAAVAGSTAPLVALPPPVSAAAPPDGEVGAAAAAADADADGDNCGAIPVSPHRTPPTPILTPTLAAAPAPELPPLPPAAVSSSPRTAASTSAGVPAGSVLTPPAGPPASALAGAITPVTPGRSSARRRRVQWAPTVATVSTIENRAQLAAMWDTSPAAAEMPAALRRVSYATSAGVAGGGAGFGSAFGNGGVFSLSPPLLLRAVLLALAAWAVVSVWALRTLVLDGRGAGGRLAASRGRGEAARGGGGGGRVPAVPLLEDGSGGAPWAGHCPDRTPFALLAWPVCDVSAGGAVEAAGERMPAVAVAAAPAALPPSLSAEAAAVVAAARGRPPRRPRRKRRAP